MRIDKEIKKEIIEYAKTHSICEASKKFKVSYNAINFWVNPEYRKYSLNKSYEIHDRILDNSKKYSLQRRNQDPEYAAKRNKDTKRWQKEKRKNDSEWRNHCVEASKKYYENNKHAEFMLSLFRKAERKRRALKKNVNENYTKDDEAYTYQLFECKCAVCGAAVKNDLTIDHWYPLSKGYPLTRKNAVLMCKSCNRKKWDKLPADCYDIDTIKYIEEKLNKDCTVKQ